MKNFFTFFIFLFSSKKSSFQRYISELNKEYFNTGLQFDEYGNPIWEEKIKFDKDH